MFHIWWLQIQRKESLELTVFCVRNFLMSLKVPYSKAEVSKGSEKRVESCNMLFLRACRDVRRWLLTRADLVAGTAQKTTSCPNLYSSQTNLLTRQRQPGECVLAWGQENTSHTSHSHSSVSHSHVSSPCSFISLNTLPMEDSSAIWAPPPFGRAFCTHTKLPAHLFPMSQ